MSLKNSKSEQSDDNDKLSENSNRVSIRLPQFWSNSPATWFIQAEAQFELGKITSDGSKYNYVIASLPQDIAESITDLLEKPPLANKYRELKTTLIERHSLSIELRLKKLISDEHMGDKKPSDFYRYLRQLAGSSGTVGDELIIKLWLSRLPHLINIALIPQKHESSEKILKIADQIWEAMQASNVSSVNSINQSNSFNSVKQVSQNIDDNRFEKLEREINSLKSMISNLNTNNNRSRSKSRSFSNDFRQRSNSYKRFNSKERLCWYHFKYGNDAQKCIKPCAHSKHSAPSTSSNSKSNSTN